MDGSDNRLDHGMVRVRGGTELRPYEMRFVRPSELDALFSLHQAIVARLDHPHVFRPDSKAFMAKHIDERGRTVGTFVDRQMVAYAAISFPDDDPDNLGRDLPLPPEEYRHVADYDGSAVHPDFRGNKLQLRMTDMRHRYALVHDRYHILGTVSPYNAFSLANFLALGCRVKNIKRKYGDMIRLIIHCDLHEAASPPFEPGSFREMDLVEIDAIARLLAQGFHGFRVAFNNGRPSLCLGRPLPARRGVAAVGIEDVA